jgi:hypothetical protein
MQTKTIALVVIAIGLAISALAAERTFPFTAEENRDGARFVWFIYQQSGFPYDYLPAAKLRTSPRLRPAPNNKPEVADIAWWKEYVAIYEGPPKSNDPKCTLLITAEGRVCLEELEQRFGKVLWLCYDVPE